MHGTRGSEVMAVVIESDGKNTLHESVQPHKDLDSLTRTRSSISSVKQVLLVWVEQVSPTCVKLKPANR